MPEGAPAPGWQTRHAEFFCTPAIAEITLSLEKGESLQDALKEPPERFPPLFLALAAVGEETGHLPEVLQELEKYYLFQQKSWRLVRSTALMPAIQLVLGIGIITVLIFVLGLIARWAGFSILRFSKYAVVDCSTSRSVICKISGRDGSPSRPTYFEILRTPRRCIPTCLDKIGITPAKIPSIAPRCRHLVRL